MKSEHGYRASPESKARRATRSCPDCRSPMLLPPCLLCRLPSPLPTLPLCEPRRSTHYLRTRSQSHLSPHHNSVPQMERNCTKSENEEIKKPRFQEAKIVEVRGTPTGAAVVVGLPSPPDAPTPCPPGSKRVVYTVPIRNGNLDYRYKTAPISGRRHRSRTSAEPLCRTQRQS